MKPTYEPVGGRRASDRVDPLTMGSSPVWSGCLVFGLQPDRRQFLVQSARSAGWDAVECSQEQITAGPQILEGQRLVIFDLKTEDGSTPTALQGSAERAARQKGILIVLCGNAGNVAEEIWARQMGVWLYLPGAVDDVDLAEVFEEAVRIDEKRHNTARTKEATGRPTGRRTKPK